MHFQDKFQQKFISEKRIALFKIQKFEHKTFLIKFVKNMEI